jgi:hypothetical protein
MKTTQEQYEIFQEEVQKWLEKLGLSEWDVHITTDDLGNDRGEALFNVGSYKCTISLTDTLQGCNGLESEIRRCAKHEVLHLLIGKLYCLAKDREWNEDEYASEEHGVINRLVRCL